MESNLMLNPFCFLYLIIGKGQAAYNAAIVSSDIISAIVVFFISGLN